jgi:transposase
MIAHSIEIRRRAQDLLSKGQKKSVISRELGIDYDTLLIWAKRFAGGEEGAVLPRYERCGRKAKADDPIQSRAIELRNKHQEWGAEYIRLNLVREFPEEKIVQANQIRKWLIRAGLVAKKTKLPVSGGDWVSKPLQRVQVDAKEQLQTADGLPCCYLNFIDECTGSELDAFVFPLCPNQSGASKGCL